MPMNKYRRERQQAALRDLRVAPALRFAEHLYPEDIGVSVDYQCNIWLVFHLLRLCQ